MSDPLFARFGREFSAGDILCREGDPGDVMYVIQTGSVRITKMIAGEERVIAMLGPGEFLGELAILNGKPRSATATVVETTRCLLVEARTLEKMVAVNAEIAMRLIKKLAKRLDSADALIEVLMHRDPKARIMLALARNAEAFGEKTAEGILIRTRAEDLARDVGVDAVAASDVMQRLRRLRLASEVPGGIVVADVGRLQDFVEFLEMPQKFGGEG
ncbi:Crp/Fnr family transcriptional regulator [Polyangium sorediatum]|uniref:Crp/Fnr family transcriptional regulator n=1 Tax=Polyangium sorediatum TaxID=889274 RepID=A0ABT6NNU9_9BACT|nr:Crp/Fnr family transcriptional regulator [Polyangium sorediatum]MDI1429958.1 Crp/Fnr family transcriptional regulator [Polyangium sorediatum]